MQWSIKSTKYSEINDLLYEFSLSEEEPIQLRPYPLALASEKIVANEVENILEADVIKESNSP